jgi:hypothetical protein
MSKHIVCIVSAALLLFSVQACQTQHKIETVHKVEVAPMHITIDVNVKVDKALDDFFGELDAAEQNIK